MNFINKLVLAALVSAMPVAAHATDLLASENTTLPVASSGFDWNRFYAGVYGAGQGSPVGGAQFGIGADLGVNARLEFVLVGAEVRVQGLDGSAAVGYAEGLGRAGIALTDSAILYGAGGLGASFGGSSESDGLLGGGVELALTDTVSVDARYLHGFPITGANPKDQVTVGANFHF